MDPVANLPPQNQELRSVVPRRFTDEDHPSIAGIASTSISSDFAQSNDSIETKLKSDPKITFHVRREVGLSQVFNLEFFTALFSNKLNKRGVIAICFNLSAAMMGAGVLGLPRALANSGWGGLILLAFVGIVQLYTCFLLCKCFLVFPAATSYQDLARMVFSVDQSDLIPDSEKTARNLTDEEADCDASNKKERLEELKRRGKLVRLVVFVIQMLSLLGVAILYLGLAGSLLSELFSNLWPGGSPRIWTIISFLIITPSFLARTMKENTFVAITSLLASVILVVVMIVEAFMHHSDQNENFSESRITMDTAVRAFATMSFAFGGHPLIPSLWSSLVVSTPTSSPQYDEKVVSSETTMRVSFMLIFPFIAVCYVLVSALNYWSFGGSILDIALLSYPKNVGFYIATTAVAIHVGMAYSIFMNPAFLALESFAGLYPPPTKQKPVTTSTTPPKAIDNSGDGANADAVEMSVFSNERPPAEKAVEDVEAKDKNDILSDEFEGMEIPADSDCEDDEEVERAVSDISHPRGFTFVSLTAGETQAEPAEESAGKKKGKKAEKEGNFASVGYALKWIVLRVLVGCVTLLFAILFPFFGDVQSLIGGGTVTSLAFILPPIFYVKTFRRELSFASIAVCGAIVVLGVMIGTAAVLFSLIDIAHNFQSYTIFG